MDPDDLKKIAAILDVDLSKVSPDNQKLLSDFVSSRSSNAPAPTTAENPELRAKEAALREKLLDAGLSKLNGERPDRGRGTFLFNPITNQIKRSPTSGGGSASYDLSGNPKETGPGSPDDLRTDRLTRMREGGAEAAAEQARRQGIRDSVALPISNNIASGVEGPALQGRQVFQDKDGRVEDPAALKARLTKEGMNPNDATIAAGQRSRDMFAPPNAKKEGFGMQGGQASAVMNAAPERRMSVMEQLKDARKDNLQALVEARRNNPFRKEVGITTKIEAPDGTVLAQRGEGEVRTDRAGNTVDSPGRMNYLNGASNLKDALTIYNNFDTAKRPNVPVFYEGTNEPSMTGSGASRKQETVSAPAPTVTNAPEGGRIVRGIYGTAFSGEAAKTAALVQERRDQGIPIKPEDKLYVKEGDVPAGFQRNPDGKVVATRPDPIKEQLAKNQQDALDKAADKELMRRQTTKRRS